LLPSDLQVDEALLPDNSGRMKKAAAEKCLCSWNKSFVVISSGHGPNLTELLGMLFMLLCL